jgi:hypothetical protein
MATGLANLADNLDQAIRKGSNGKLEPLFLGKLFNGFTLGLRDGSKRTGRQCSTYRVGLVFFWQAL